MSTKTNKTISNFWQ